MDDRQLKVFITSSEFKCEECGEDFGRRAWIHLEKNKSATSLTCADLDHLVFLPASDATLTRRARRHSRLAAVVLKWSRARKRYERQGLLVESAALERAERECEADAAGRKTAIATHACRKYSDRIGRSAAAKKLEDVAVRLAVQAHLRHAETSYDDLLLDLLDRSEARESVRAEVQTVLDRWEFGD